MMSWAPGHLDQNAQEIENRLDPTSLLPIVRAAVHP